MVKKNYGEREVARLSASERTASLRHPPPLPGAARPQFFMQLFFSDFFRFFFDFFFVFPKIYFVFIISDGIEPGHPNELISCLYRNNFRNKKKFGILE